MQNDRPGTTWPRPTGPTEIINIDMPPPATKKRKTEAAVAGSDASSAGINATLSIEMIGKVASFANYGDDLMNICKAVGPKESAVIRHICLRNNMGFLRYTLQNFPAKFETPSYGAAWKKTMDNVPAWMEINTDWRKHCTKERTEDEEISTCIVQRESNEGDQGVVLRTNPLILFNNPTVAIEMRLVDVLKHLVEEVGIDINSHTWTGYMVTSTDAKSAHLLVAAEMVNDSSSFDYLLSREDMDVHAPTLSGDSKCVWETMYEHDTCSCRHFRDVIEHSSFDPNRNDGRLVNLPIFFAFLKGLTEAEKDNPASTDLLLRKFKILLNVGADPQLVLDSLGNGGQSLLDFAKLLLGSLEESGTNPLSVQAGRQMIAAMEEKIAGEG